MLVPVRPPQMMLEKRRGEVERGRQAQGQVFKVSYFIDVVGAGEALVAVNFPVAFSEYPAVYDGGACAPNTALEATNYPWSSVMVHNWDTVERNNHEYYTGATLILVVGGTAEQTTVLHFHAEGQALQNPI